MDFINFLQALWNLRWANQRCAIWQKRHFPNFFIVSAQFPIPLYTAAFTDALETFAWLVYSLETMFILTINHPWSTAIVHHYGSETNNVENSATPFSSLKKNLCLP